MRKLLTTFLFVSLAIVLIASPGIRDNVLAGKEPMSKADLAKLMKEIEEFNQSVAYKPGENVNGESGYIIICRAPKTVSFKSVEELKIFITLANLDKEEFKLFYDKDGIPVPIAPESWGTLEKISISADGELTYAYTTNNALPTVTDIYNPIGTPIPAVTPSPSYNSHYITIRTHGLSDYDWAEFDRYDYDWETLSNGFKVLRKSQDSAYMLYDDIYEIGLYEQDGLTDQEIGEIGFKIVK